MPLIFFALFAVGALHMGPGPVGSVATVVPMGAFAAVDASDDVPDKRAQVKALLDEFAAALKKRGEADPQAIEHIAALLGEFEKSGPKDREAIAKALGGALAEKRKELGPEQPDERLAVAAATALGRMGVDGGKQLQKNLEHKNLSDKPRARREVILALGNTRFEAGADDLMDLAKNHDAAIQAAAAEALGSFEGADQKLRKAIFKALFEVIMPVKNTVDGDASDSEARERLNTISTPFLNTLKKVTGHEESDLQQWQRWWNHNKNEDWKSA